jgi:hypothetical protein
MSERPRSPLHSHDIEAASCTPSLRKEILGSTPVFRGLDDAALSKVNDAFSDVGFDRGQLIVREGDSATKLFVVATGVVKLSRRTGPRPSPTRWRRRRPAAFLLSNRSASGKQSRRILPLPSSSWRSSPGWR